MEYLLKASAVIILFYLCFSLFLKKETFFQHNRWFLFIGLITAMIFPLIVIPVYIQVEPIVVSGTTAFVEATTALNSIEMQAETTFDWSQLIPIAYSIGFAVFFIQFIFQFGSLIVLLLKNPKLKDEVFTYVIVKNKISPFSFFKWIVYNPDNFNKNELDLILTHEKVHAKQLHSIDLLLAQLACVIFWFNPLIWLYRKEVRQNLEYIADSKTQAASVDKREYQHLLLKTSISNQNISLSNNFYNSLIKERIVMLKKSRSNRKKQLRYLLIIPLLGGLLMSMNTEEVFVEREDSAVISNEITSKTSIEKTQKAILKPINSFKEVKADDERKPSNFKKPKRNNKSLKATPKKNKAIAMATPLKVKKKSPLAGDISITLITKNTTDLELDDIKAQLKKEGLTAKFKGVKRNKKGEITAIKIDIKSKKSSSSYNINSDETIDTIKIIYDEEKDSISISNGHSNHGKNTFVYEVESSKHKAHKSIKGNHVYVVTGEAHEHEDEEEHEHNDEVNYIIKAKGKKGKVKRIKRSKNIEVISGDDNEVIEILIDDDDNDEQGLKKIIVNGKEVNVVEGKENIVVKGKAKNVWVTNVNDKEDKLLIEIGDNDKNIVISGDNGKNPLFILDGKEITKDQMMDVNTDLIESVTVLKDKSAVSKYGKKAKDGVIIIKTKKKN